MAGTTDVADMITLTGFDESLARQLKAEIVAHIEAWGDWRRWVDIVGSETGGPIFIIIAGWESAHEVADVEALRAWAADYWRDWSAPYQR